MARSDRRTPQQRARKQTGGARDRGGLAPLDQAQQSALDDLTNRTAELAQQLRAAQTLGRDALIDILAPLDQQDEAVMVVYAVHLGAMRGAEARDAADVAQALGELAARREVAREARRSRLRLRSAGFPSSLTIPAGPPSITATDGLEQTPPIPITRATPLQRWRKQLVEALATRSRESGEVALVLAWQEGIDPDTVRGYSLALDFWRTGVSGYSVSEPMSRRRFQREIAETLQMDGQRVPTVTLNWAGARRLVQEALLVNAWRGVEPDEAFRTHRAVFDERLLAEPDEQDDEARADIAEEADRFAREGDRPLIRTDLEAEETLANWLGAWCFGDYGLSWDLLSNDNTLRRGTTRDEYIALRRQWAGEADPGALRLTLIREQQQRASALWVPGAAGRLAGSSASKDLEAFWSVVLRETPLAGQLEEIPLATLASNETGRHWYWTSYNLARDAKSGLWLLNRIRDEGAASQALTVEELQKRIKDSRDLAEQTAQNAPENPRDPRAMDAVRAVTGALVTTLHYDDAQIVKLPLDESVYRSAIDDARTMNNHERAAALLERMLGRFSDQAQTRFELGVEQYLAAEQYASQDEQEAAMVWLDRAIVTMTAVVEQEPSAEHLQGLAELLARRGRAQEAETRLREALRLDGTRASAHADLASVLMGRVSGENVAEPEELTDEQKAPLIRESLAELREAARLDGTLPGIFTRMGAIYELRGQPEDARLAYEEAVQRNPQDATGHYALGALLLSRQEDVAALPHLEAAVELEPLAVSFRLALAAGLTALGRTRDATRELDLIDRLQPNLPQVRDMRAILARQQHDKR